MLRCADPQTNRLERCYIPALRGSSQPAWLDDDLPFHCQLSAHSSEALRIGEMANRTSSISCCGITSRVLPIATWACPPHPLTPQPPLFSMSIAPMPIPSMHSANRDYPTASPIVTKYYTLYWAFLALPFCRPPFNSFSALLSAVKARLQAPTLLQINQKGMTIQNAFIRTKYPQ